MDIATLGRSILCCCIIWSLTGCLATMTKEEELDLAIGLSVEQGHGENDARKLALLKEKRRHVIGNEFTTKSAAAYDIIEFAMIDNEIARIEGAHYRLESDYLKQRIEKTRERNKLIEKYKSLLDGVSAGRISNTADWDFKKMANGDLNYLYSLAHIKQVIK